MLISIWVHPELTAESVYLIQHFYLVNMTFTTTKSRFLFFFSFLKLIEGLQPWLFKSSHYSFLTSDGFPKDFTKEIWKRQEHPRSTDGFITGWIKDNPQDYTPLLPLQKKKKTYSARRFFFFYPFRVVNAFKGRVVLR